MMAKKNRAIFLLLSICLLLTRCTSKTPPRVEALVNGHPILETDVMTPELESQIRSLRDQKLQKLIDRKVLDLEGARLHTTGEELIGFFDRLMTKPSEPAEIKSFFEQTRKDVSMNSKISSQEIEASIKKGRVEEARRRYIQELRNRASIRIFSTTSEQR